MFTKMNANSVKKIKFEFINDGKEETLFEKVYRLVKAKDENALTEMIMQGDCLSAYQGSFNPITLLAKEGDVESVDFLIDKFQGSRNHAVYGYAMGDHVSQVNHEIAQGASRNWATLGYAFSGNVEQVNQLIKVGANLSDAMHGYALGAHDDRVEYLLSRIVSPHLRRAYRSVAVCGYAHGGNIDQVNKLLTLGGNINDAVEGHAVAGDVAQVNLLLARGANRDFAMYGYACSRKVEEVNKLISQGASPDQAVNGYASRGHVEEVNKLIHEGANINAALLGYSVYGHIAQVDQLIQRGANPQYAIQGYSHGCSLEDANLLRLMALTNDKKLRSLIAKEAKKSNPSIKIRILTKKATRLNTIMREYQFDFKQAQALTMNGTREWLLQGPQLVKNDISPYQIPEEIYFHITSFVVGLPSKEAAKMLQSVNKKLFDGCQEKNKHDFKLRLFSKRAYIGKQNQAETRYIDRIQPLRLR